MSPEACAKVLDKIARASQQVHLLPVSKGQPLEAVLKLWKDFPQLARRLGENYLDEFIQKKSELGAGVEWHFLGRLQSRKLKTICSEADYLHGISRSKELEILGQMSRRPKFFIQVNISNEEQKNGVDETELALLIEDLHRQGLNESFAGLMGMAAPIDEVGAAEVARSFRHLAQLRGRLCPGKDLSMGMSADYEIALDEGANWLRIGSLLFGERTPRP